MALGEIKNFQISSKKVLQHQLQIKKEGKTNFNILLFNRFYFFESVPIDLLNERYLFLASIINWTPAIKAQMKDRLGSYT